MPRATPRALSHPPRPIPGSAHDPRRPLAAALMAALLAAALVLGGCASTRPMAYGPDPASVKDAAKQPVYLMTITVKNPFKTYYLPSMKSIGVLRGDGKADGDAKMKEILGGKGANLAEMTRIGLPVPAGFTISTTVRPGFGSSFVPQSFSNRSRACGLSTRW